MPTPSFTFVTVAAATSGLKMDVAELVNGPNTVERQVVVFGDPSTAAAVAGVMNSAPTGTEYGVVVRNIPSGQQPIIGVQDARVTGAITTATGTVLAAMTNRNVATFTVWGTYAGVTYIFEASDDGGTTWFTVQAVNNATGQVGSTWTPGTNASASYDMVVGGFTHVRLRATAWTSGTMNVGITAQVFAYEPAGAVLAQGTAASGSPALGNPVLMAGLEGANARALTMKAASTAAAAADPAAVVALSPNSPITLTTPTAHTLNSAATTNATSVKASAGTLYGIAVSNVSASTRYFKLYNKASAPTVGTDTPVLVIPIAAGGVANFPLGTLGLRFGTGLAYAITGAAADTDTTAIAAGDCKVFLSYL